MSDPKRWSTPADIAAAVHRRWQDGSLLRGFARREPFATIDVPLRGPSAADLGEHFDAARAWAADLVRCSQHSRAYDLVRVTIGGQHAGRTEVPGRALVSTFDQAWTVLGVRADAERFASLVTVSAADPGLADWVYRHPAAALAFGEDWKVLREAVRWLDANRGSGRYLRQINAPGVDTKFIERHRRILAGILGVPASASGFLTELGFARKPDTVRLRFDAATLGMPAGLSEGVFRLDELRGQRFSVRSAWIIENEVTYLSVPVPPGGVVLWGKGYDADEPASLRWLADTPVHYWGDVDTHGFAILSRVRAWLPQTRSFLMDRETLLAHEDRWGSEGKPTSAALNWLDAAEAALYADLVTDTFGSSVRLEQERIDWDWAQAQFPR